MLVNFTACVRLDSEPDPLSDQQLQSLHHRATRPETVGVTATLQGSHIQWQHICRIKPDQRITVPFVSKYRKQSRLPLLRLEINRYTTYAVADTGASGCLTEYNVARRARLVPLLHPSEPHQLLTITGQSPGGRIRQYMALADTISIGDLSCLSVPVGILDDDWGLGQLSWLDGYRVETILGGPFFQAFHTVSFDFPREQMVFSTQGRYDADPARLAARIPFQRSPAGYIIQLRIDEGPLIPVLLDTGGTFGLWLSAEQASQLKLPGARISGGVQQGGSVGRKTMSRKGGLHSVQLGGLTVYGIPLQIQSVTYGEHHLPALLGNALLARYKVTIDHLQQQVFFERP
jgi:hypothetical protein